MKAKKPALDTSTIRLVAAAALIFLPAVLHAQSNELSATVGVAFSPDAKGFLTCGEAIICGIPPGTIGNISYGFGFSWQATYAHRLANFHAASLYLELPAVGSPSRTGPGPFPAPSEFSTIFFTPSAQFKFLPDAWVSPFASAGGGFGHFRTGSSSANSGAVQLGGGVDFRTPLRVLGVRAELRDFITGRPNMAAFNGFTSNHFQHMFAGAGVVVKF
ncbi:MAG TPA: hypothetical protein VF532_04470 [Candidatus Angelobacter sp.]